MLQRKRKQSDEDGGNEVSQDVTFKRSFAHVDGNWPSHVYFSRINHIPPVTSDNKYSGIKYKSQELSARCNTTLR